MKPRYLIPLLTFLLPGLTTVRADAELDYLLDLYRHLHANPELSFQEEKTAARISGELEQAGFRITRDIGGHGFAGVLENGPGPVLLLRTDLDALPVPEETGLAYASRARAVEQTGQEVSVMHACGHDIHMTVFTGTARDLARRRDEWSGTLVMIGQPAEERGSGARAMLEDGLFQRFPRPDYNLAVHVNAELPAGRVAYVPGWAMANVDSVDITVFGRGGHGAYPHTTVDPVVLAAAIILRLQTLVSREVNPSDPAVVTVGSIHGGAKHNVIPDQVNLQLTVRSYSDEVRDQLLAGIARIARAEAQASDLPEELLPVVTIKDEFTPSLWNDPELTRRVARLLSAQLGAEQVVEYSPSMGGEDFALYGRQEPRIPSLMLWLGAVDPVTYQEAQGSGQSLPSLHSSRFAPAPEQTVTTGIRVLVGAALDLLAK